jgi:hypothetical protein
MQFQVMLPSKALIVLNSKVPLGNDLFAYMYIIYLYHENSLLNIKSARPNNSVSSGRLLV